MNTSIGITTGSVRRWLAYARSKNKHSKIRLETLEGSGEFLGISALARTIHRDMYGDLNQAKALRYRIA
jgi:hypothetical protein